MPEGTEKPDIRSADESGRPLVGRTFIVTGASRRVNIGAAVVRQIAAAGGNVVIHGWSHYDGDQPYGSDPDALALLRNECIAAGVGAIVVSADFADPEAAQTLVTAAVGEFGHVDGLVVCHARGEGGYLSDLTAEDLDLSLAVNTRATALLAQAFAQQHSARTGGRIVFFTSGQYRGPMVGNLAYVISKGAVQQMTATIAAELAERAITVNCVDPGPTDTGWAEGATHEELRARFPQGHWGQPEHAAKLVTWLLSDDGSWITGETIRADGGFR